MAGLLDPNEDFISPDERKAITQQNLFSTLLQGGMQLVAGGENLLPWQRAQMIGQAAQTFGGMPAQNQQMLANAAQQKLVGQKYADKKRESQILSSDDFKTALSQLPPEMQALARINPQGAIAAVSNYRQSQAQAQREDAAVVRQDRLLQAQLDRQPPTVKNDEYGRLVAYDPTTRSWSLVNMGGGDQRSAYGLPGVVPAQQPAGGQPAPQSAPSPLQVGQIQPNNFAVHPNPNAPTNMPVSSAEGNPSAATANFDPATTNYMGVFGPSGLYRLAQNKVRGATFGPTENDVKAGNAQANWNQIRLNTIKALATEMPGRNSKYTAQEVAKTLPESGAFFTGPETAMSQIDAAQRMIEGELSSAESAFNAPGNVQMRGKIAENIRDLNRAKENLAAVNKALSTGLKGTPQQRPAADPPSGATVVGKTKKGLTVYQLNGQQYVK